MDAQSAAAELDGCEYGEEGNADLFEAMKAVGLVAVFGASDDLMEFRGAINDEIGCYDGGKAYLSSTGLFNRICDNDQCPHEEILIKLCTTIQAVWCEGEYSWTYRTDIPHETFEVLEDGEKYCRGIVFKLSDAA
jgi:hypothetical protein